MILVGGGSQLEGFREQFRCHPMRSYGRDVDLRLPGSAASVTLTASTLGDIGVTTEPPLDADTVFLLPALGLSYPAEEIPDPTLPEDIAPSPPPPSGPTGIWAYEAPEDD